MMVLILINSGACGRSFYPQSRSDEPIFVETFEYAFTCVERVMKMHRKSQQDSANDGRYSRLFYSVDDCLDVLYLYN